MRAQSAMESWFAKSRLRYQIGSLNDWEEDAAVEMTGKKVVVVADRSR